MLGASDEGGRGQLELLIQVSLPQVIEGWAEPRRQRGKRDQARVGPSSIPPARSRLSAGNLLQGPGSESQSPAATTGVSPATSLKLAEHGAPLGKTGRRPRRDTVQ